MSGQVVPFPTATAPGGLCPRWCRSATTGHAYRYGLDDSDPAVFHRLHTARLADLADGQARLDLHQIETTSDTDRPGNLGPAEVVLSMTTAFDEGCVSLAGPEALASFIDGLRAAADRLEIEGAWEK